jgi:hypothetical protein
VGLVRGGAGTALVGSAQTVADRIKEYADLGIDTFVLSGYPHLEEAYRFAELVFRCCRQRAGKARRRQPGGPFGETVANLYSPRAAASEPLLQSASRSECRKAEGESMSDVQTLTLQSAAQPARPPVPRLELLARQFALRLLPWLLPVALIAVWQAASAYGWLSTRVLPAPLDVLRAAWALAESGELWTHVKVSAGRALAGLAIGGSLGLLLGLLTGSLRWAETLLDSTIQMVRNIPALALIPLVILWFGIDESASCF